jgi:transaldolase
MRILIDSADLNEIKQILEYRIISGITTNPSLVSKTFKDQDKNSFMDFLKNVSHVFPDGEISAQVTEVEYDRILDQGQRILDISSNIVLKLPLTRDGIKACKYFVDKEKKTNITLCFTANQALICALAGATYVSVFLGRTEDNFEGTPEEKLLSSKKLIEDTKKVFYNYKFETKILGASIRNLNHINICSHAGVDAITISPKLFYQMIDNELSISGAKEFVQTWSESNLLL